jgi:hypothetical protein
MHSTNTMAWRGGISRWGFDQLIPGLLDELEGSRMREIRTSGLTRGRWLARDSHGALGSTPPAGCLDLPPRGAFELTLQGALS